MYTKDSKYHISLKEQVTYWQDVKDTAETHLYAAKLKLFEYESGGRSVIDTFGYWAEYRLGYKKDFPEDFEDDPRWLKCLAYNHPLVNADNPYEYVTTKHVWDNLLYQRDVLNYEEVPEEECVFFLSRLLKYQIHSFKTS